MYRTLQSNASPTCQFGVSHYITTVFHDAIRGSMRKAIDEIRDGSFARMLDAEEAAGYPTVAGFYAEKNANIISRTEDDLKRVIRQPPAESAVR